MKTDLLSGACLFMFVGISLGAAPRPAWLVHDGDRPLPPVVTPAPAGSPVPPPSDAVVLFDGSDAAAWVAMDGTATQWEVKGGVLTTVPGSGNSRTRQAFGDCQLHVEWNVPAAAPGTEQRSGNSGVMLGGGRYEIQVLNSYGAGSYADGLAAAVYGQHPPLANASRAPGQWQVFDLIWTAPRFDAAGNLVSKARITLLHNGVLVQNNVELEGPTTWIMRPPYQAHPGRLPIVIQDHGHPVQFRNIWVRELGNPRHPEFQLPDAQLDSYVGEYGSGPWTSVKIGRLPDGLLSLKLGDAEVTLHAASPTDFYAEGSDVRCQFDFSGAERKVRVAVGGDISKGTWMVRK